ncbi:response regulator [Paracoccus sediminicola]|uniref:response regulator n=1 Tax=Paracoccus sediminicola TaxID=3017783 RepID=UPI0022F01FD4|nr:response regulator [Paracoccus sediminicola]WBU55903.1 response regulator [Paracoccus sediminicola]
MQTETNSHAAQPQLWQAQLPGRPLSGLTVLVVEDSRIASEAMRLLCLRSGARIRRADSLRTAMRHLQTYRPSVVIVDMGLPDGNGADLIGKIRALGTQSPVVLAISGNPDTEDAALAAGAAGFMIKPIENLAVFQQTLLAALPSHELPKGLRVLPNDIVAPDKTALRQDLTHVAQVLAAAEDGEAIGYIARFLTGVARSAHDAKLAEAAAALARDHQAGRGVATDLTRISGLVHDRLAAVASA